MIHLIVYGKAEPAGSKRAYMNKGRIVVADDNRKARPWKEQVASVAGEEMAGKELLKGPLWVEMVFHQPRPRIHYGKKGLKPSAPAFPTTRPDVLKLARGVEDALTGVIWQDDAQIVSEWLFKQYGEPSRAEIFIREVTEWETASTWSDRRPSQASAASFSTDSSNSQQLTTDTTPQQIQLFTSQT